MKKLLIILLFFSLKGFSQTVTVIAPKGKLVVLDTTVRHLNITGTYLTAPNDSTIGFDSSKVVTDVTKNPTRDSFYIYKGGVLTSRLKDSSGGGSSGWNTTGNTNTDSATNFWGTTDNPQSLPQLRIRVNNVLAGIIDSNMQRSVYGYHAGNINNATGTGLGVGMSGVSAFGYKALAVNANTSVGGNSAFGSSALLVNTTGLRNTAVGYNTLKAMISNNDNVAVGWQAGLSATGGTNTFVGSTAGDAMVGGTGNTAIGYNTLGTSTAGINNTAVGQSSLTNNSGDNNVAVGSSILVGTGNGGGNVALGYLSTLNGNTSGSFNTAIQRGALGTNSTHSHNVAIGFDALNASDADNNVGLGARAAKYITSETGVYVLNSLDRVNKAGDQNGSPFYFQQSLTALQKGTINGALGIGNYLPTAWLHLPRGHTTASSAPLKFKGPVSYATTAASGTGAKATLTFATTTNPDFAVGSTVNISGITPAGYNNSAAIITDVTPTTISYANTTTGVQTVAGTIVQGGVLATPEAGAVEYDVVGSGTTRMYVTGADGVRGIVSLTFTGTAAPATTPSAVGDKFVDTTNKKIYFATGTSSSADWTVVN